MIRGMHAMFYSSQAEALRSFLREKLELKSTDVGDGWLIFDTPEADLGVHPTEGSDAASGTADICIRPAGQRRFGISSSRPSSTRS